MVNGLTDKHCVPCEGGGANMPRTEIDHYLEQVKGWTYRASVVAAISKEFKFPDFTRAMAFVNQIAELAEAEGHHPNIHIFYNLVRLEATTHAIHGLSENDFILAAKIDELVSR